MSSADCAELIYQYTEPPLQACFKVLGGHYSGEVNRGNLFLQTDIPEAPLVRWAAAQSGKLYTLVMLDLDGNALGSYPDQVPPGDLAPLRHWIVGNIPGELLKGTGYREKSGVADQDARIKVVMPYRAPHIRLVSDRYGLYLFEQKKAIDFAELPVESRMKFDYQTFLNQHELGEVKAANYFVAIYISESPFSGKPFSGVDVLQNWHQTLGKGKLSPSE